VPHLVPGGPSRRLSRRLSRPRRPARSRGRGLALPVPHPGRPARARARPLVAGSVVPVLVVAAVLGTLAGSVPSVAAVPPPDGSYEPPVDAPVADAFRPPASPWGAGNRGLKYATSPGTTVRAVGPGEVVFAGPVAGALHVTVLHPDGLRTSYSFLEQIGVRLGQRVQRGEAVGTAGEVLHLGARRGDAYLDPASLFEPGRTRVRLVPFDEPLGWGRHGERSALRQLVAGAGGAARAVARDAVDGLAHGMALAGHLWSQSPLNPVGLPLEVLRVVGEAQRDAARPCTASDVAAPRPTGRRVGVLVGGLGSSSDRAAIDGLDVAALGYRDGDVVRFSYAGGRVPAGPSPVEGPERPYRSTDTHGDVRRAAAHLADLVEAAVRAAAGAPVDVLAHSLGGLVARLALEELAARHGEAWLEQVDLLVTLGTPHEGADLATMVDALGRTTTGTLAVGGLDAITDLGAGSVAVGQLSEVSDVVAPQAGSPVVRTVSIAASGDLVVAVPRTRLAGATSVVVTAGGLDAHDRLPATAAATREVALALAGLPPTCRDLAPALRDRLGGLAIGLTTDAATGVLSTATAYADARLGPPGPVLADPGQVAPRVTAPDPPAG
jgi:hypothetical protein